VAKKAISPSDAALDRVRAICFGFAGTEERLSHGAPSFHVRGKMFVMFVGDRGDGTLAVWCKATHEDQRRHVAANPSRFFVPPYVGVGGWVGVRLDGAAADWIELSIIIEEGWSAVVPKSVARGPVRPPPPPPKYPKTDPDVARAALDRMTAICGALRESVCERRSKHATYRVGKKAFAYFLDNHHGDGIVAVCFKMDKGANAKLAKADPKHFYVPAYIGARGWVGMRLDLKRVDWKDVAQRASVSYRSVAPKRLMR
jgi:hypothetical protein